MPEANAALCLNTFEVMPACERPSSNAKDSVMVSVHASCHHHGHLIDLMHSRSLFQLWAWDPHTVPPLGMYLVRYIFVVCKCCLHHSMALHSRNQLSLILLSNHAADYRCKTEENRFGLKSEPSKESCLPVVTGAEVLLSHWFRCSPQWQ